VLISQFVYRALGCKCLPVHCLSFCMPNSYLCSLIQVSDCYCPANGNAKFNKCSCSNGCRQQEQSPSHGYKLLLRVMHYIHRCKEFTWGNFRNFECLYLIAVGYVAGGFPAVVILEILAWHPAASTEKNRRVAFPSKKHGLVVRSANKRVSQIHAEWDR